MTYHIIRYDIAVTIIIIIIVVSNSIVIVLYLVSACLAWGICLPKTRSKQFRKVLSLLRHHGTRMMAHRQLPALLGAEKDAG